MLRLKLIHINKRGPCPRCTRLSIYCAYVNGITFAWTKPYPLLWRHNEPDGVSNHQPHECSPNRLFGHRSKKTSKLRVTGLCAGNSPETGEFPAQMASNAENVSIWWRHHAFHLWMKYMISSWWTNTAKATMTEIKQTCPARTGTMNSLACNQMMLKN